MAIIIYNALLVNRAEQLYGAFGCGGNTEAVLLRLLGSCHVWCFHCEEKTAVCAGSAFLFRAFTLRMRSAGGSILPFVFVSRLSF